MKVSEVSARDIKILARLWLDVHREEAIADAKEMIDKSPELRKMYEKEQRRRGANISTNAQTKIEPLSMGSAVQNSSANWRGQ